MAKPNDSVDHPPAGVKLCLGGHSGPCAFGAEPFEARRDHAGTVVELDFDDPEHRRFLRYLRSVRGVSPVSVIPVVSDGFRQRLATGYDTARRTT